MTESKKPLVADVLDYEHDIAPYKFIKIFSGVGSGKTQLACKLILGDKERRIPRQTVLLITSRRSTVEETLGQMGNHAAGRARAYGNISEDEYADSLGSNADNIRIIKDDDEFFPSDVTVFNKSVVCTNAHIEQYFRKQHIPAISSTHLWELFDTIIVDEVHSLITDATHQSAPFYVLELINEFLRRCTNHDIQNEDRKHLILMTGTPAPLDVLDSEILPFDAVRSAEYVLFDKCENVLPKNVAVVSRKAALGILQNLLKAGEKAVYFSNSVATKHSVYENWHIDRSVKVGVSFSSDDGKKIIGKEAADEMEQLNRYIAGNRRLPDDIQLFVSTSRNKEGINIENKDIRFMFVESHFSADIIQMAGRIRAGVEQLYIICDAKQLCTGVDAIAVDFTTNGIVPVHAASNDKSQGYANEHYLQVCAERKVEEIPFNSASKLTTYGVVDSYIDYVHKTFPYVRYSYIQNKFAFYEQRRKAEMYTLGECDKFSEALTKSQSALRELIQSWFPGVTVQNRMTDNDRCKELIENEFFPQRKNNWVSITPAQHEELKQKLGEILGKPVGYLNTVLSPLGYGCSKQDSRGYYKLYHGKTEPSRNPSRKLKKRQ